MSSGSCDKGFQALALDVLRRVRVGAIFVTARDADERVPVGTVLSVGVQAAATLLQGEGGITKTMRPPSRFILYSYWKRVSPGETSRMERLSPAFWATWEPGSSTVPRAEASCS